MVCSFTLDAFVSLLFFSTIRTTTTSRMITNMALNATLADNAAVITVFFFVSAVMFATFGGGGGGNCIGKGGL